MSRLLLLECTRCHQAFPWDSRRNRCHCGGLVRLKYDLADIRNHWSPCALADEPPGMWRYHPVLPFERRDAVMLGEGAAWFLRAVSLGPALGNEELWIQDDGGNPVGSCEARGAAVSVSLAKKLGYQRLDSNTAGNAATALAAYGAAAGIAVGVNAGADLPRSSFAELRAYGAEVTRWQPGLSAGGAFWEPYRIDGLKTAGYEMAERFGWNLPDAVICPCGDGAMIVALWKAFHELKELGWAAGPNPKMIAVQAAGCDPLVKAFEAGAKNVEKAANPYSVASELRVAELLDERLILAILRESGGRAVAVGDEQILDGTLLQAAREGMLPSLEGGACVAAARELLQAGALSRSERIVLFNPASGLRSMPALAARFPGVGRGEQDKLGGLILPR